MGKTKTKYPVQIILQFVLPLTDQTYVQKEVQLKVNSSPLTYEHIKKPYEQFLEENNINYPTVLEYLVQDERQQITEEFIMQIPKFLEEFGGKFTIIVRNYMQIFIDQINMDIEDIRQQIEQIKQRLNQIPTREQIFQLKKNSLPILHHNQSAIAQINYEQKQIDLGVLFSQPIFDQIRKKTAATPVDFRSEIQRLHLALKSSINPNISLKCQIATKQNLKHLIKYSKPKILHIICHGTKQGALQFQDDSRTTLGSLQLVKNQQIMDTLKNFPVELPQIVFINSCYSQKVGQVFFKLGVNYVITIDSEDTIEDQAAQIFSEHFYRNIFSGQKVKQAFKEARQRVKMKHNSFGCCCRHSSKQVHKPNCRWLEMIRKIPNSDIYDQQQKQQKHKLFHVPSELCKCDLKNLNRHKLTCEWARQALFHINNDFRIMENGVLRFPKNKIELPPYLPKDQLVICCCFNYQGTNQETGEFRLPHSQSNKFKILENIQKQKRQIIFQVSPRPYKQLSDYTSPELVQTHQKIQSSIMGRQRQIFDFMKRLKDLNQGIYIVYGKIGVGRTSFALKCVTYLIQRRVYEMYFYIDLYGIKDRDIFRYKFNEVTKFNYDGQIKVNEVKNKTIIIILDNSDDFFELQRDQLYQQLKFLRQQLHKGKIILTFKEQIMKQFDFQKIHTQNFYLQPLSIPVSTRLIFTKMRHLFEVTVQYLEIDGLVRSNPSLRIPKIIQSLCQSFSSVKTKIKLNEIKKKLETMIQGDLGGTKLIEQNLDILKIKSQESYQLLLFISQFSEGISLDDFKMLSLYDKKDSKIHLPINKNWESSFSNLFQKLKLQDIQKESPQISSVITEQSDHPMLKNTLSNINNKELENEKLKEKQKEKVIKGQSYFLDQVGQNRFIVKRYIRDFIWKKHQSQSNYYMKHLFVGYMAVMLEIYFKWLVDSKYIHQDLMEYSALSEAGLFGFKNNIFNVSLSLTDSVRIAKQYNIEFQRILSQHPAIIQKIKRSDPSIFITNHKQDFLNIYEKRWDMVFQYLKENKKFEDKICMAYLQNLMIFIPTAFKIAKVQTSLLKYVISKSWSLLAKLQKYSEDQKYAENQKILAIQLKLQLMKASIEIQKSQIQSLRGDLDFNKESTLKLVKNISDQKILEYLRKFWNYQKTYILMYKQYTIRKESSNKISFTEKSKISYDKMKAMIENVISWMSENWEEAQEVLLAKRNLVIGLTYLNILKNTMGTISVHANAVKLKKQHEKSILKMVNDSAQIFKSKDLMKLCLRSKLTALQIYTSQNSIKKKVKNQNTGSKGIQFYEELNQKQRQILQCDRIYTDRKNNLISFAQFQIEIKRLKKLLKQKLWQQSSNTLVCMKPVPLTTNGQIPIIQNLARKKNRFRKEIQKVVNPQIDLCSKFQILTKDKLKEELQNGCTLLLLSANIKIKGNKLFFVFQGSKLQQDFIQINPKFVQQFDMSKIKILIIAGKNSSLAINLLSKLINDPPFMISLGNIDYQQDFNNYKQFQEEYQSNQYNYLLEIEERRRAEVTFLKEFVRKLMQIQITSIQQIVQICQSCQSTLNNVIQMKIQYEKRNSPMQIQHKKGTYKDLSPGYQKNHNIDMKNKVSDNTNFISLRRWKQTFRVFNYIERCNQSSVGGNNQLKQFDSAYINVFGNIGSGKSTFIQQIARLFVQRQKYSSGVYIIDGKVLQKKYQGEFEAYFNKESQIGKIMALEDFQANGDERLMLIIDDFHVIKPRSNGRFNLFLRKIVDKKVNLIIVTNTIYQKQNFNVKQNKKDSTFIFKKIKPIVIERLCPFEIDLIAYNTLDLTNKKLLQRYQNLRETNHGDIGVKDIIQLKSSFYGKKKQHDFILYESKDMKKMQSTQS